MIRQWQELFHDEITSQNAISPAGQISSSLPRLSDFRPIQINHPADVETGIRHMLETPGPVFLNMAVDRNECVFPMIPSGVAHNEIVLGPNHEMKTMDDKANVMA